MQQKEHMMKCTNVSLKKKLIEWSYILKKKIYVIIPRSFLVINVCNQEKTLRSPCISVHISTYVYLCTYISSFHCV